MAVAAVMHHSSGKRGVATAEVAVQTDAAPTVFAAPPPVIEYVEPRDTLGGPAATPCLVHMERVNISLRVKRNRDPRAR